MRPEYRLLDHTADLGIEVRGRGPADLFENCALAMFDLMVDVDGDGTEQTVTVDGHDWADLMVNWLRELLYWFHGLDRVLTAVAIEGIGPTGLTARVRTVEFDSAVHGVDHEIKAVTYHRIQVAPVTGGWQARVIFDT